MTIRIIILVFILLITGCSGTRSQMDSGETAVLDPNYHVITGTYRMDPNWSIDLPCRFNKRNEKDRLVIWKPGFTIQIGFMNNESAETMNKRLIRIKERVPSKAFDIQTIHEDEITRFAYRVSEKKEGSISYEFHGFVIGDISHVEMAFSFDRESDLEIAREIWSNVKEPY